MNHSQCILEIDLSKIRANYKILSNICKNSEVASIVKANAYGLGADKIAKALEQENCKSFFVASINEAINLRNSVDSNASIFVLNGVFSNDVNEFERYNLIPVLNHLGQVEVWSNFMRKLARKLPSALHIDTGLNRLGMPDTEIQSLINQPDLLESLSLQYVISHLASSEESGNPYNLEQLKRFKHYLQYFPNVKASLSNSQGISLGEDYHFDLVRPGASLYGITGLRPRVVMHNVLNLTAPIIQLKTIGSNSHVGYNTSFTTKNDTIIATLPIGYADGYSRIFSNCGEVFIDGHIAPVIGKVSMDLVTIDVTNLPPHKIFLGQKVEIINDYCTIDKIASIIGGIGYEILTLLHGPRFKRIYKNDTELS